MNIYHIAYAPTAKTAHLFFWGCNMSCRGCVLKKEIYDWHMEETIQARLRKTEGPPQPPQSFLKLEEVMDILRGLEVAKVIFLGAEATIDPGLPRLAKLLHEELQTYNILLTNGLELPLLDDIDEVSFSIKAYTDSLHYHYTGTSNQKALQNFIAINQKGGIKLRAESVLIPGYIDCPEVEKIAQFIAGADRNITYRVDGYIPVSDNPWRRPTPQEIEKAASIARRHLLNVSCLTGHEDLKYEVLRVF
ncbi:radical SAM protein [Chloroflexota bacterium]